MIPLAKPNIGREEREAVDKVLRSGKLTCGKECELFEQELCEYLGAKHAVVVSSGTATLHLSLMALDIRRRFMIIVPDFTYLATANVVELMGAVPVFADVELDTYNMSNKTLHETWTEIEKEWIFKDRHMRGMRITGIIPVYQFGLYEPIEGGFTRPKIVVDAACAIGAKDNESKFIGNSDNLTCFSFHPRKNLTTGEGGAIITNNKYLAGAVRKLRQNSVLDCRVGLNYKMTDFQAAMGRVQLRKLDNTIKEKRYLTNLYIDQLYLNTEIFFNNDVNDNNSCQSFMIILPKNINRDNVIIKMAEKNIETGIGSYALHTLPYYRIKYPEQYKRLKNSNSTFLANQGLSLPLYCGMTEKDVEYVCKNLMECINDSH